MIPPRMALPVCKKDLGRAQLVQLSTSSLVEHSIAHPEIGITDYQRLQKMLDEGELYEQEDRRVAIRASSTGPRSRWTWPGSKCFC